ncbi:MAG TPA: MarR family winged helix-turn-helix transcriptional regulator [Mycobacteriales bacterium]
MPGLSDNDYALLLGFRTQLRRFDRWSRDQAAAVGLTQAQHQLLLAVRGHDGGRGDGRGPTIGDIADYLLVRHHSAVELVDRVVELGLVAREGDADDHRMVHVVLTEEGQARIKSLTAIHLDELRRLGPSLEALVAGLPDPVT